MFMMRTRKFALTLAATTALTLSMIGTLIFAAPAGAADTDAHPAHIHAGACPAPGAVVFSLSDVSVKSLVNGTPTAGKTAIGQANPLLVEASSTTVKATLVDLADGKHSIVIHKSAADIATYLVCGNIGGVEMGPGGLSIGLSPVNNSGYIGFVTLVDNGDGSTTVNLFLMLNPVSAAGTGGSTSGSSSNSGSSTGTSSNSANGANNSSGNSGNMSMGNESDANSGMGNGSDANSGMGNESDGNMSSGNGSDGNMSSGNGSDGNMSSGNGSDSNSSGGNTSGDANASGNGS